MIKKSVDAVKNNVSDAKGKIAEIRNTARLEYLCVAGKKKMAFVLKPRLYYNSKKSLELIMEDRDILAEMVRGLGFRTDALVNETWYGLGRAVFVSLDNPKNMRILERVNKYLDWDGENPLPEYFFEKGRSPGLIEKARDFKDGVILALTFRLIQRQGGR